MTTETNLTTDKSENVKTADVCRFDFNDAEVLLAKTRGVDITMPAIELAAQAAQHINVASVHFLDAGICLLKLKSVSEHGAFKTLVESIGIKERTARDLMQQARFVASLPEAEQKKMLTLPKSKVLALATTDPEVIDALLEDDDLDDFTQLSVRDLRTALKEKDIKINNLATQLDIAQLETSALKESHASFEKEHKIPLALSQTRLESMASAKQAMLALDNLESLHAEHTGTAYDKPAHAQIAERNLFFSVNAIFARVAELRSELIDTMSETPTQVDLVDQLTLEEAQKLANDYDLIEQQHVVRKHTREVELDNSRPRGRGRPRKI